MTAGEAISRNPTDEGRVPEPRVPPEPVRGPVDTRLRLSTQRPDPDTIVIAARGDVDMLTASRLADMLSCRLRGTIGMLVVDLSRLAFLGTAGLSVLAQAHLQAQSHDVALRIVTADNRPVTRALVAVGLHRQLPLSPSVDLALQRR